MEEVDLQMFMMRMTISNWKGQRPYGTIGLSFTASLGQEREAEREAGRRIRTIKRFRHQGFSSHFWDLNTMLRIIVASSPFLST